MSLNAQAQKLIEAPLQIENGVHGLALSLWLYLWLVARVNHRGYVCKEIGRMAEGLSQPIEQVVQWLGTLEKAGLIACESPAPYLVIRLCSWSSDESKLNLETERIQLTLAAAEPESDLYVPVRQQQLAADLNKSGKGGQGEREVDLDTLAGELGAGESDLPDLEHLVRHHPSAVIAKALSRVRATPQNQIKKSRLAFFRFLLHKLT
jgi:hypothetical protein